LAPHNVSLEERTDLARLDFDIRRPMADVMVFEAPGVDLMTVQRSASLSLLLVGQTVSALAEAILFFQQHPEVHASSDGIRELSEHLSMVGAMIADACIN
jgi:hypothetical protein